MKSFRDICTIRFVADFEKKEVSVAARIPERLAAKIDEAAGTQDRSRGYVIRALLERGMAAYEADGMLRVDVPNVAPVVAHIGSDKAEKARIRRELSEPLPHSKITVHKPKKRTGTND